MSTINPDYFKPIKNDTRDTPIADAMAKMVNQQLERLGIDEKVEVKSEKPKSDTTLPDAGILI